MDEAAAMLLLGVALMVSAAAVVYVNRRRQPTGAWHCAACDYNLTGLTGDHCPECGADLHAPSGRTRSIRWPVPAGRWIATLLVVGALIVWGRATLDGYQKFRTEWYRYRPTFLVLRHLTGPDLELRDQACKELYRRQLEGSLSPDQQRAAMPGMLANLPTLYSRRTILPGLNEFCGQAMADGLMTPQQIQEFLPWVDWVRCRWGNGDLWLNGELNVMEPVGGQSWVVQRHVEWIELDGQRVSAPIKDAQIAVPRSGFVTWIPTVTHDWPRSGPRAQGRALTLCLRTTWYSVPTTALGANRYVLNEPGGGVLMNQLIADGRAQPVAAYRYTATLNDANGWQADFKPPPIWLPIPPATQRTTPLATQPGGARQMP